MNALTEAIPDSYQQKALTTWYQPDDPSYLDPRHPLIKLAGEAGELTDLYGKEEYKPNFSWWNCKHCGYGDASHDSYRRCPHLSKDENIMRGVYTPLVLDELGDYFYYLRILTWQQGISIQDWHYEPSEDDLKYLDILHCLSEMNYYSAKVLREWLDYKSLGNGEIRDLRGAYQFFTIILRHLDCTLEYLTELNYQKLNSEPSAHGWKSEVK